MHRNIACHLRESEANERRTLSDQWRGDRGVGGAGCTGRHLLGAAKGQKTMKILKKIDVKIQTVSFICVCVQEKQSVTASVYLVSYTNVTVDIT